MGDEGVKFLEGSGVDQRLDAFPCRQLSGGMLLFDALFPATLPSLGMTPAQFFEACVAHFES